MSRILIEKGKKLAQIKSDTGASGIFYERGRERNTVKNRGGLAGGIGYVAGSAGLGLAGVGEGLLDIGAAGIDLISGDTEAAKNRFIDNKTADAQQRLSEWYSPGKGMEFAGQVSSGIGQSVGYGLLSAIPGVGVPMMYASIGSQGVSSAAQQTGDVGVRELAYGATVGAVEGLLESKLGAGVNAAKGIGSAILKKTGLNVAESAAKAGGKTMLKSVLLDTAKGFAGEFAEEAISEAIDPALLRLYGIDKNAKGSIGNVLYAGLVGGLSGGIMSAGPFASRGTINNKNHEKDFFPFGSLVGYSIYLRCPCKTRMANKNATRRHCHETTPRGRRKLPLLDQ